MIFKKLTTILVFSFPCILTLGQDLREKKVSVFFGQVFSGLYYTDSGGNADQSLSDNIKSTYGVSYQTFVMGGFYLRPELSYKNLGAQSIVNNIILDWDFHYLDLSIGAGFGRTSRFIHSDYLIKPYVGGSLYTAYTYKATQQVGSQNLNLQEDNAFNRLDFGVQANGGIFFDFSKDMGLLVEYRFNHGLRNLENNISTDKQTMFNRASAIVFGLSIKL